MKRLLIIGIVIILGTSPLCSEVSGQGILVLSNLEEPKGSRAAIASNTWLSMEFHTGTNPGGYRLNSVALLMEESSGNPSGFSVSLYDIFEIDTGHLTKIGDFSGPDSAEGGILNYTISGISLLPSTFYSIVITAHSHERSGAYVVSISNTANYISEGGWSISNEYLKSINVTEWSIGGLTPPQLAIYATAIPTVWINATDGQFELHWEGFEGVAYQLQTRSSVTDSEWTNVGDPLTGDGTEITATVPALVTSGEAQAYYRVEVLPAEPPGE